jgi:hypothetical protein
MFGAVRRKIYIKWIYSMGRRRIHDVYVCVDIWIDRVAQKKYTHFDMKNKE